MKFETSCAEEIRDGSRLKMLYGDILDCEWLIQKDDARSRRRLFCQTSFTFVEVYVAWIKDHAMEVPGIIDIDAGELELKLFPDRLCEEVPRGHGDGNLYLEDIHREVIDDVADLTQKVAKKLNLDAENIFSSADREHLEKTLSVRHRIMYPRSAEDTVISEIDMHHIRLALYWIFDLVVEVVDKQKEIGLWDNQAPIDEA